MVKDSEMSYLRPFSYRGRPHAMREGNYHCDVKHSSMRLKINISTARNIDSVSESNPTFQPMGNQKMFLMFIGKL